nr:hypothetical protein HK105_003941 [Polyrhizophydium stewartii]
MELLVAILIALSGAVAAGEVFLRYQISDLPRRTYGTCLRITCVLALITLAIGVALCFLPDNHLLYSLSQITMMLQVHAFLLAQLEMLRMLLPAYGVTSPHIVSRVQIASMVVAALSIVPVVVGILRPDVLYIG